MKWEVLRTEEDYNEASLRLMEIFHAQENTIEFEELKLLIILIEDFDDKNYRLS